MSKINLMLKKDDNFPLPYGNSIRCPNFPCQGYGIVSLRQGAL
jgi:hypothetical protein